MPTFPSGQRGFGAITAIVILVILASLGAAIVSLSSTQAVNGALDITATRAWFAARSGVEWGAYQVLQPVAACASATNIGSIDAITVSVTCKQLASSTTETGTRAIYRIIATACNFPVNSTCPGDSTQALYVERRLSAIIETPSNNSVQ